MTTLNTSTIQALIPNRYPLFYIDHVSELVPDESLRSMSVLRRIIWSAIYQMN